MLSRRLPTPVGFLTWPSAHLTSTIASVVLGKDREMRKEFRYGKKIQQLRKVRAWTQEQLAEAANIDSTRTIQRVEKDLTKSPETLQAIAGAFDVDLDSLRTTWFIPESQLVRTWLITNYEQFINVEQANPWHMCSRAIMAPLTGQGQQKVNELLKQIYSDRDL